MTAEQLLPIITEWLKAYNPELIKPNYVRISDSGKFAELEGVFDLEDLAKTIAAASQIPVLCHDTKFFRDGVQIASLDELLDAS